MEAQLSRDKYQVMDLGYTKQHERKSLKFRSSKNSSFREPTGYNRTSKPPIGVTIARRQSNCSPMLVSTVEATADNSLSKPNPFAVMKNEATTMTNNKSTKCKANNTNNNNNNANDWKSTEQASKTLFSRSVLFPGPSRNSDRQQHANVSRSNSGRRNLTLRQTVRGDQKKRKMGDKAVKTFAQIVATGSANAKPYHRNQK